MDNELAMVVPVPPDQEPAQIIHVQAEDPEAREVTTLLSNRLGATELDAFQQGQQMAVHDQAISTLA